MQVVYTTSTSAEFLENFQPNSHFKFNWQQILDENQHSIVIIAYYKDQLVGIANFERISSDRYNFVYNIEVVAAAQHHHVGARLLALVMQDSFAHGFDGFVKLLTKTSGVEKFYQQLGGEFFGQQVIFDEYASTQVIEKYLSKYWRL